MTPFKVNARLFHDGIVFRDMTKRTLVGKLDMESLPINGLLQLLKRRDFRAQAIRLEIISH